MAQRMWSAQIVLAPVVGVAPAARLARLARKTDVEPRLTGVNTRIAETR